LAPASGAVDRASAHEKRNMMDHLSGALQIEVIFVCVCVCILSHWVHAAIVEVPDLPSLKCSSHWSLGRYPAASAVNAWRMCRIHAGLPSRHTTHGANKPLLAGSARRFRSKPSRWPRAQNGDSSRAKPQHGHGQRLWDVNSCAQPWGCAEMMMCCMNMNHARCTDSQSKEPIESQDVRACIGPMRAVDS
jgi:hypothetical protein